jgi:hypothetical protein
MLSVPIGCKFQDDFFINSGKLKYLISRPQSTGQYEQFAPFQEEKGLNFKILLT